MTQKEFEQINKKLDRIIKQLDKVLGNKEEESPLNKMLRKATSKDTSDKDYCNTLIELNKLPFALSEKQMSWLLVYTPRHSQCGQSIQNFIRKQFEKHQNKNEFIQGIAGVLRSKYTNDNNGDFIEKMISHLKEL